VSAFASLEVAAIEIVPPSVEPAVGAPTETLGAVLSTTLESSSTSVEAPELLSTV
jgi:hypothetical protein